MGTNTGCKTAYFATFSNQCTLRNGGTAGQVVFADENGMNRSDTQENGPGASASVNEDNTWHNSTDFAPAIYYTVPGATAPGTYYIIIAVKDCNIYMNPSCCSNIDNQACISFTVTNASPTPTSTITLTSTCTATPTISNTYTISPTYSASPTFSSTSTVTPSNTPSPLASATNTSTVTPTSSDTPTFTSTRTSTPTSTASPTPSITPSPSMTSTPLMILGKSSNKAAVTFGDTITFCINYRNDSGNTVNMTVWDTVPAYTTYEGADSGGTPSAGMVIWTLSNVLSNQSGQVCFWVKVTGYPFLPSLNERHFASIKAEPWRPAFALMLKREEGLASLQ